MRDIDGIYLLPRDSDYWTVMLLTSATREQPNAKEVILTGLPRGGSFNGLEKVRLRVYTKDLPKGNKWVEWTEQDNGLEARHEVIRVECKDGKFTVRRAHDPAPGDSDTGPGEQPPQPETGADSHPET